MSSSWSNGSIAVQAKEGLIVLFALAVAALLAQWLVSCIKSSFFANVSHSESALYKKVNLSDDPFGDDDTLEEGDLNDHSNGDSYSDDGVEHEKLTRDGIEIVEPIAAKEELK